MVFTSFLMKITKYNENEAAINLAKKVVYSIERTMIDDHFESKEYEKMITDYKQKSDNKVCQ